MTSAVDEQTPNSESVSGRRTYPTIDADGHFLEPEGMWREYLPRQYWDMAPRKVTDSMGRRRTVIADQTLPALRASQRITSQVREDAPDGAGWDPAVRLAVMDSEGVDAAVMYPTTALHLAVVEDLDVLVALCQAYNNWAADFCAVAPERLFAPAVVPQRSIDATRREISRAVGERGMCGVFMRPNPVGRVLEDPAWDSVWAQLAELNVPLGFHEAAGLAIPQLGSDRTENFLFQHMAAHPFEQMLAMLTMIGGGILERHPNLRVAFVETGCGWVPYWLERLEHHVDEFGYDEVPLSLRPTEYFQRQCLVTTDSDEGPVLPATVSCLGADNLAWSTDFPHPDHEWRGMVDNMMRREDLSEADKVKLIGSNAAQFYGILADRKGS